MKRRQLDLYAQCNVEPRAPMDVFTAECCSRCVNPECSRSNYSNSKFESRVSNWYDRLFINVPRMAPDDERFKQIAGQRFLLIDPAGIPSAPSQGWVDPRNLGTTAVQVPVQIEAPRQKPPAVIEEPPSEALSTVAAREPANLDLGLVNTPVKQGQMIGGRAAPSPEWRTPVAVPSPPNAQVVKTGAKIRIGS